MLAGNRQMPVEQFGGLRLDLDPAEAGWGNAIDLQNVDFDRSGRVKSRMGSEKFNASAGSAPYTGFFSFRSASDRLLATGTNRTDALDSSGTVVATTADGPFYSCATVGTASQTECYIAYSTLAAMRVYNGTSLAVPTATVDGTPGLSMPVVQALGVTPWDNRLVAANSITATGGPGGGASSYYHVHFSNPGSPQLWDSTDYVILNPGDGEGIAALVMWREYLFAFKRSKYYVFYGTSTDSTGGAIFNYREVRAGVGVNASWQVAAARDGVYFADSTGVYRTTGGEPQLVSQALAPAFDGTQSVLTSSLFAGPSDITVAALAVHDSRVYVPTVAGNTFVYDIDTGMWTYWNVAGLAFQGTAAGAPQMAAHTFGSGRSRMYFGVTGVNDIARFNPTLATDRGSGISSFYRSGFATPGGPGQESTLREVLVEGAGTVGFDWSRDYGSSGVPGLLVLSTPPAQGRALYRKAFAGENLSYRVTSPGSGSAWQVNRLTPFLREARGSAEKTT